MNAETKGKVLEGVWEKQKSAKCPFVVRSLFVEFSNGVFLLYLYN